MFQIGDEVAAAVDLGGVIKGRVRKGTPGVVVEPSFTEPGDPAYTVRFRIEQDDLLVAHHTTLTQLGEECLVLLPPATEEAL